MFFSITNIKHSLHAQTWLFRLLLVAIGILVVCVLVSKNLYKTDTSLVQSDHKRSKQVSDAADMPQVLTESAVEHLVEQAAKQKYIQDVFNANPKLPLPKKPIPLQPNIINETSVETSAQPSITATNKHISEASNTQRCNYNNQLYVVGDIVKSPQGWVRCTPTLVFPSDNTDKHFGNPSWISIQ
jgi:hypothetical protein